MKTRAIAVSGFLLLAGCAGGGGGPATVERMYVIDCGENHVKDLSRWTPGVNVGKPHVFGDHCYLIKHAQGWMLWDSGNPDRYAAMPNGFTAGPNAPITAYMKKPLAESLKEIGVAPAQIRHFAMSHSHGDHSGNANLFAASTLYMQAPEYDAVFGPEPQKFNFVPGNFEKLRGAKAVKLNGDHDVFGDGSVTIKSAPGHTMGHQVLVVRLPRRGPVMLTGDMVHLLYSWNNRVVPSFNFNVEQSGRTIDAMKEYASKAGAQVWITHDKEQHASIPKSPNFVE
jgi:N-acyl homoserine lactone hydrolase